MTTYVATMIYHAGLNAFVSVEKNRGPKAIIGLLNFVGGKVEDSESFMAAHIREAKEETGIELTEQMAGSSVALETITGDVVEFRIFTLPIESSYIVPRIPAVDDVGQRLEWCSVSVAHSKNYCFVPNLKWLIPYLLDNDRLTGTITEVPKVVH